MEPIDVSRLPAGALILMDSAPIIYVLEGHPRYSDRFEPIFDLQASGDIRFAVTTMTIAEVLTGPLAAGEETLARRYRSVLESWQVIDMDSSIAESAARMRALFRLKLADAVQVASAIAINADALVTHDRDFSRVRGLNVIS
ncbi:MAG: type II toxin-antitoxin system VapC family toxin [Thermoanaerobaculia bacterium]